MSNINYSTINPAKVAIVGRTNVGKSTLFNRLTESGKAIVSPVPGTTRDRNYGECSWRGKTFLLVDTGGLKKIKTPNTKHQTPKTIEEKVSSQTFNEINDADIIVLLLDANDGVLPQEKDFANFLRKNNKKVIVTINKVDNSCIRKNLDPDVYKLGAKTVQLISAINGVGTGDLLDEVVKDMPTISQQSNVNSQPSTVNFKIAIIGRTNVGKSSLLNAILGKEYVIVSETPHTTRETQDININYKETPLLLIDTAGIRKKSKIDDSLERQGARQSIETLKRAGLILFVIESNTPIAKQDKALARLIIEAKKPVIVIANKWDLVKERETSDYEKFFKAEFPHLSLAPVIFVSAKTGKRIDTILDQILFIKSESEKQISENILGKFLEKTVAGLKKYQGKRRAMPRLLGLKQAKLSPLTFEIAISAIKNQKIPIAIIRYIENRLREKFGFIGVPMTIRTRSIKLKR